LLHVGGFAKVADACQDGVLGKNGLVSGACEYERNADGFKLYCHRCYPLAGQITALVVNS
jgi:hypothetical protein